jgi:hypothetical protein
MSKIPEGVVPLSFASKRRQLFARRRKTIPHVFNHAVTAGVLTFCLFEVQAKALTSLALHSNPAVAT